MPRVSTHHRCLPWLLPILLLGWACASGAPPRPAAQPEEPTLSTVAFGACARQDQPQTIWEAILRQDPGLFVFMGDNIYSKAQTRAELDAEYALLGDQPGYRQLLTKGIPVEAVWDDHDFGANDGGADNPLKDIFAAALLDFFAVPEASPRRSRPGLYGSRTFGPPGRRVQLILLDTRYFRSPLRARPEGMREPPGRYLPSEDPTATILGDDQWAWLEEELRRPAEVRLLITSIQAIPTEHGWEKWGNMPAERRRLFSLIQSTGAKGVLLFSGDRHLGEISRLPAEDPAGVGYPLYELTTAGLTHGTSLPFEPNAYRIASEDIFREPNFGTLSIDWSLEDPVLSLRVLDQEGRNAIEQTLRLSHLAPADPGD